MSSGYGIVPPGSRMTYSSGKFTQELSYLLSAVGNVSGGAVEYASDRFATPLGMPEYYAYDGSNYPGGEQIAAAGGQMVSCREIARVGQLVVNEGVWLDGAGEPYQLADRAHVRQILEPAYPGTVDGYGLLTWLNTDMTTPAAGGAARSGCCGPRWGGSNQTCDAAGTCGRCCEAQPGYTGSTIPCKPQIPNIPETHTQTDDSYTAADAKTSDPSEYIGTQMIGDSFPDADKHKTPERLGVAMGQFAKYMFMLPEQNVTVVTLGQSEGQSLDCRAYNDDWTLSLIWRALEPALAVAPDLAAAPAGRWLSREAGLEGSPRPSGDRTRASIKAAAAAYRLAGPHEAAGSCSCR
jgi:hypothetical protein